RATVLSTSSLRERSALERGLKVVPGAHDRDGNAGRVEPKQERLRAARGTVEAGGVDVDERGAPPGEGTLDKPVDERGLELCRHDGKFGRAGCGAVVLGEQLRKRGPSCRLRSGEHLERPAPVSGGGMNMLHVSPLRADDEHGAAATSDERLENRAGGSH